MLASRKIVYQRPNLDPMSLLRSYHPFYRIDIYKYLAPTEHNHQSPFTIHQSPITILHSPFTIHLSPFTFHLSPITNFLSPFTPLTELVAQATPREA